MKRLLCVFPLAAILVLTLNDARAGELKGILKATEPEKYRIVSIAPDSSTESALLSAKGAFSLQAKKNSSLHLLGTDGRYVGPVVLPLGKKAATTVSGKRGTLGRLLLKQNSFVTAKQPAGRSLFQQKQTVSFDSKKGTKGSGKLGLVASSSVPSIAAVGTGGSDSDRDGLPDILDIDDDGDLALDSVDTSTQAADPLEAESTSTLRLSLETSLNARAASVSDAAISAAVQEYLRLSFFIRNNGTPRASVQSVNVDCGLLSYCAPATGSATISGPDAVPNDSKGQPWINFDSDGDGLPNLLVADPAALLPAEIIIFPKASTAELRPGDTVLVTVTSTSQSTRLPVLLPFYFVTVPALVSYSSGAVSGSISYPVAPATAGVSLSNPIILGSTSVQLSFYRPQRPSIAGVESGSFVDMGLLNYGVYLSPAGATNSPITCAPEDVTSLSPFLEKRSIQSGQAELLHDTATAVTSNVDSTLTFSLNLESCLNRNGVNSAGLTVQLELNATTEDRHQASQSIWFQLP